MTLHTGRHFLQIPGPTNVPDRVLRAMDMPTMDHRGAEVRRARFCRAGVACSACSAPSSPSSSIPSSGTGAWEAAIVNVLSPGDKVLMAETGQFAVLWHGIADKFKLDVDFVPGDWRRGADIEAIEARLAADRQHRIKAVMVVHNETSTGCVTHPLEVRKAHGSGKASGAADGRYHFRPRLAGIRARRLGRRCLGRRLAKGHDAAAGPRLQRGVGKGARGGQGQSVDAVVLGLAGGHRLSTRSAPSPTRRRSIFCMA